MLSMIVKHCIIILIVICLWNARADATNFLFETLNTNPRNGSLYSLLKNLLEICDLGSRKIIIYDNFYNLETFNAIAERQSNISASLFTDNLKWKMIRRYQFDDLRVDTVIVSIRIDSARIDIQKLFTGWRYNRDCIVHILPIPIEDCTSYGEILELIMRFYFSKAYFFCSKEQIIHVYTHDPYGDTKPLYWDKIDQGLLWGKNWTFYTRSFHRNKSQLCRGFNFKRTDPSNQTFVVFGLDRNDHYFYHLEDKNYLYNDEIEQFLHPRDQDTINNLKKLMKRKFLYYTVKVTSNTEGIDRQANEISGVDGLLVRTVYNAFSPWNYFYPILYEPLAILSHNRGPMTPLEKIAKFYGKWTLSSLIIILMITFVVVWFSTKRLSLTGFNILRLLINGSIITSFNTWRLKLFFSMIFFYFLIIHATFSGHLAEFLTKVEYRSNIDTLEQLNDPNIKKIYNFGYIKHGNEDLKFLTQKLQYIHKSVECEDIINQTNYACIAPMVVLEDTRSNQRAFDTLYISKNTFGLSFLGYSYRPGFLLCENFNWAFMFLFEAGVLSRWRSSKRLFTSRAIAKHVVRNYVNYRDIAIKDLYFAFTFLLIGHCLGFICFLLEIILKNQCYKLKFKTIKTFNIVNIEVQPGQN